LPSLTKALTFPTVIPLAYIGVAILLAVLLRGRNAESRWRYRDVAVALCMILALSCIGLALSLKPAHTSAAEKTSEPCIEVDMLVSRGNFVDVYLNDWQKSQPERAPVVAGKRHVYRFTRLPRDISLVRLDPTDLPDARFVIYSLTVKAEGQTIQQFRPAELKNWRRANIPTPAEEDGGLVMLDTNDDPILWTPLAQAIRLPERKKPIEKPFFLRGYFPHIALGVAALLLLLLVRMAAGAARLGAELPGRYRNLVMSSWGALLITILAAGGTHYLQNQAAESDIGIEVDMLISRGSGVDVWLNDWQHPGERLPVVAGQRHVYRFLTVPREISLLRLDPTDLPDARIVLYGITIRNQSQIFRQFGPAELKGWSRVNLSEPKDEDGGLAYTDLNDDPMLITPLALQLPGGVLQALSPLIGTADALFLIAMTTFLLLLLARMGTRTGRMQALLIAAANGVAWPIVYVVLKLDLLGPPPVRSAVGYASYTGYDKANEYLSALAVLLVCISLGYLFAKFAGPQEDDPGQTVIASRRPFVWIAHVSIYALVLMYFMPDLTATLRALPTSAYQYQGWDSSIATHWVAMMNAGLRPMRDFWFPYSGSYIERLPPPTGLIFTVLHFTIALWFLYLGLFLATGKRISQALVLFGLFLTAVLLDMFPGWYRYVLSIDVGLLYVGLYDIGRLQWKVHLPFAVFVGYAFFYEPTQVIYAGVGIAAHTIVTLISHFEGNSLRERLLKSAQALKQRLVTVGLPMLAGIAASLLVYAANGMLPGFLDFEKSIGDQGDYGAWPSEISRWMMPALQPETVFLLMFLLVGYAVYRRVRLKDRPDPLGTALIVLCGLSYAAAQKQILRPHIMTQIRMFPYVTLLIFGLIVWRERKPVARIIIAAFLGCILGIAMHRNVLRGIYQQEIATAPGRVSGTVDALLHHRADFDRANATLYSRSRFVGYDAENRVVDNLTGECGLRAADTVYVLGDYPIFYMLLNQRAPYISNTYNSSPIYEQQKVLDWFHREHPRFVIWGTGVQAYDGVPHTVRLPLIYTYVTEHYQLLRDLGSYQILVERPANQPPDLEYWRRMLGDHVDLGAVPGLARLSEYAACGGDVALCDAVLVVKYPHARPAPRTKVTVDIDASEGRFRVQFDTGRGKREYVVNLNRLWFWNPISKPTPRITAEDAAAEVVTEYRRERKATLY